MTAQIMDHQPASTVYAMSEALVRETSRIAYVEAIGRVAASGIPFTCWPVSARRADWDVPPSVRYAAAPTANSRRRTLVDARRPRRILPARRRHHHRRRHVATSLGD